MNSEHSIVTDRLSKRYGNFVAVDEISFDVRRGEIFGFLGANGAGKTTAIRMLTCLSQASSGTASVAGLDIRQYPEKIKKKIGYMSQKFSLYNDLKVRENIRFYGGIYGLKRKELIRESDRLLEELGLQTEAGTLVQELPLGWKQKLAFSIALIHKPEIVFLDEPTGGVDPLTRRQFWEMIYRAAASGTTLFVTTHYMDEAEYCDRVAIMVDGRIDALGSPVALKQEHGAKNMDELFFGIARKAKRKEI